MAVCFSRDLQPAPPWLSALDHFRSDIQPDVEVNYQLLPETESGNRSDAKPLQLGDRVALDYQERAGQGFVNQLGQAEVLETTEPAHPEDSAWGPAEREDRPAPGN